MGSTLVTINPKAKHIMDCPLVEYLRCCCVHVVGENKGCGFFVTPNIVITCSHVVGKREDGAEIKLEMWNKLTGGFPNANLATILKNYPKDDIAIIQSSVPNLSYAPLGSGVHRGHQLIALGFPLNENETVFDTVELVYEGQTLGRNAEGKLKDGQVEEGYSGGPVLDLITNRVIGVLAWTRDDRLNLGGWFVETPNVERLLLESNITRPNIDPKWTEAEAKQKQELVSISPTQNRVTPHNLPALRNQNSGFVGREQDLCMLAELLEQPNGCVYVTGMGGMGKSELALQYAFASLERYHGGIVCLDARLGYEGMALQVIGFVRSHFRGVLPEEGQLEVLLSICWSQWPAASEPPEAVLLIFDDQNASEAYAIENRLCIGLPARFNRLITQRAPHPVGTAYIDLDDLQDIYAMRLLAIQAGDEGSKRVNAETQAAAVLCRIVGNLPLALVLLGARLAEDPDLLLQQLLTTIQERGAEAKALQQAHPEVRAKAGLIETLLTSWEPVSPAAKELAILLEAMAPAVIPWQLVERCAPPEAVGCSNEEGAFTTAKSELLRFRLLVRVETMRYKLHPVIRQFLQMKSRVMGAAEIFWTGQLIKAVANYCRQDIPELDKYNELDNTAEIEAYIPHLKTIASLYENSSKSTLLATHNEDLQAAASGIARYFQGQGSFNEALVWQQKCRKIFELGTDTNLLNKSRILCRLANIYADLGEFKDAMPLYEEALCITHRENQDSLDEATVLHELGELYRFEEDIAKAERLYYNAKDIRVKLLGANHVLVADSLDRIAWVYMSRKDYEHARSNYIQALWIRKTRLRYKHRLIGQSYSNLGVLYCQQGVYWKSELCFKHSIIILNNTVNPLHTMRAVALYGLGFLYCKVNKYTEAKEKYLEALRIWEIVAPNHPDMANCYISLALVYFHEKDYNHAEKSQLKALSIMQLNLRYDHPDTKEAQQDLVILRAYKANHQSIDILKTDGVTISQ